MTQPSPYPFPTPGQPPRTPDPGVRPTPSPTPGPAPGTGTDYPKQGDPAPGQPGLLDKAKKAAEDALTPNWVSGLTDGITAVRAWITNRHNWVRVGWFAGGAVMFTVGAFMVAERPLAKVAAPVAKVASKVV